MVLQFLHGVWQFDKLAMNITAMENFRLYRVDKVFLHPTIVDKVYLKLTQDFQHKRNITLYGTHDHLKLMYFHGRVLSNIQAHCTKCEILRKVNITRQPNFHLRIDFPRVFQTLLVLLEGVEYPNGFYLHKDLFYSFNFAFEEDNPYTKQYPWLDSQSWLSSTVYHINCSESQLQNAKWTKLSLKVISDICRAEEKEKSLVNSTSGYIIEPPLRVLGPNSTWDHMVFWQLNLNIRTNEVRIGSSIGCVHFITAPVIMCNQKFIETSEWQLSQLKEIYRYAPTSCAKIITKTSLHATSDNSSSKFEIGYRIFDNTSLLFLPAFDRTRDRPVLYNISFSWERKALSENNFYSTWSNLYLSFTNKLVSWEYVAEQCSRKKMTLPHFKDEKSLHKLIAALMVDDMPIVYSIFIGIMTQV